jgi:hypothetical protein
MKLKYAILFFGVILFANQMFGQSLRLSVKRGGVIQFYFNTLKKYNEGITYNDYTQIAVAFSEHSAPKDSSWQMEVRALNATIDGGGTNTLPLNVIRMQTSDGGSSTSATYTGGWVQLTNAYQVVVSNGPEGAFTDNVVNISWDCGITNSVSGESPDFYAVDIDILITVE